MDVQSCINSRISSRLYKSDPLPDEIIRDILNAARCAPSPKNRQPWRFAILTGDEKTVLVRRCRDGLERRIPKAKYLMDHERTSEIYTFNIIDKAPVLILVFNAFPSKQALNNYNLHFDFLNQQAIGAAIENMLLRATELGVGSLWVGDILSETQFITDRYFSAGELVAGIVLGIPDGPGHPVSRIPLSELIIFSGGQR